MRRGELKGWGESGNELGVPMKVMGSLQISTMSINWVKKKVGRKRVGEMDNALGRVLARVRGVSGSDRDIGEGGRGQVRGDGEYRD